MKKKVILEKLLELDEQMERIINLKHDLSSKYTSKVNATFRLESTEYNKQYSGETINFDVHNLISYLDGELERLQNEHDELMSMLINS